MAPRVTRTGTVRPQGGGWEGVNDRLRRAANPAPG